MRRTPLLLILLSLLGACVAGDSDKSAAEPWSPGKADGQFEMREVGPLEMGEALAIELDGTLPAYRVESYGDTKLSIELRGLSGTDAYVVVEGPLDGDGDATVVGQAAKVDEDDDSGEGFDSRLEVSLDAPGVYRVLAGTYESLALGDAPSGSLSLEATCTAGCTRPSIRAAELIRTLQQSGQLEQLTTMLSAKLAELVPDETQRAALATQLDRFIEQVQVSDDARFPVVPLRQLGSLRAALGLMPSEPSEPAAVVTGDLMSVLGACDAPRNRPSPVNPALPELGYGHFPNRALTACQVAHSQKLAQVFASLAANNGSSVTYAGADHTTARSLVEALVGSGHTVEVRNERTYANFLSFAWGDVDVVWPVWLDTGMDIEDAAFAIPMGHSGHAWRISGPDVNARVMFYLGISGASFFAQTQTRPAWTGEVVSDSSTSDDPAGREHVLSALDAASTYLRRIEVESSTVAAGLPADGYGFVGVCNDSNAAIEYVTRGTITTYPLMRAASLDAEAPLNDGLDDAIRALPHDADVAAERSDALRRIVAMAPLAADSPLYPDAALASQMRAARAEVAGANR